MKGESGMESRRKYAIRTVVALMFPAAVAFFFSCAPITQYSVNMRYDPEFPQVAAKADNPEFMVANFIDARKIEDTLVIGKVVRSGINIRVFPKYKTASDTVTASFKTFLARDGYFVSESKADWDLKPAGVIKANKGILIGGSIDELEVICRDELPLRKYAAKIKLTVVFADRRDGNIFYTTSSESSSSLEHPFFGQDKMQEQINITLAGAIERVFASSDLKSRINDMRKPLPAPPPPKAEQKQETPDKKDAITSRVLNN